jgi:uncharacterized membrane protein YciS (DUF1049 family)
MKAKKLHGGQSSTTTIEKTNTPSILFILGILWGVLQLYSLSRFFCVGFTLGAVITGLLLLLYFIAYLSITNAERAQKSFTNGKYISALAFGYNEYKNAGSYMGIIGLIATVFLIGFGMPCA